MFIAGSAKDGSVRVSVFVVDALRIYVVIIFILFLILFQITTIMIVTIIITIRLSLLFKKLRREKVRPKDKGVGGSARTKKTKLFPQG